MIKIEYTNHLQNRIKSRKISKRIINKILKYPNFLLFDTLNQTKIAIGEVNNIYYMIAYVDDKNKLKVITIHPIKKSQIDNRLQRKRWIKIS
jgi:hypothetical protein